MAELKRVTLNELLINIVAMYYGCSVAEVIRITEEELKKKKEAEKVKVSRPD